jgi:hypothetical protein
MLKEIIPMKRQINPKDLLIIRCAFLAAGATFLMVHMALGISILGAGIAYGCRARQQGHVAEKRTIK